MLNLYKSLLIFFFLIFSLNSTFAQNFPELEKVKEIKLLESTRDDVRRILAEYKLQPTEKEKTSDSFETNNVEITVSYSEGKCDGEDSENWDVEKWKVVEIRINPKNKLELKNVNLNLKKFKKEKLYKNREIPKIHYNKTLGIFLTSENDIVDYIAFLPPQKDLLKMCDKSRAKQLISASRWLIAPLKEREIISCYFGPVPDVENLILSFTEITASCSSDSDTRNCSDDIKNIAVFAYAKCEYGCLMTYNYQVSGGKIIQLGEKSIGLSEKVLWDLSDVKPGVYTITAAVDDGCGFCGKSMTKTVTVKECADCKKP